MHAEQLTDPVAFHGEGAVWHAGWGGLRFVDMLAGDVLALDGASGAVIRIPTGSSIAAMARPRRGGGMVVATRRRFSVWDADDRLRWESEPLWNEGMRFNDGAIDPLGRVLCGTIHDTRAPGSAVVLRLGADRTTRTVLSGSTISNGLAYSADGRRAWYVDTPTRRIDVFDVTDDGELTERRPLVSFGDETVGNPDGVCVDTEDGVWAAFYRGGAARRYDATGTLTEVVETPGCSIATSCALGGPTGSTLFITTSREPLAEGDEPAAGSVFHAEVGVRGVPTREALI